MILGLAEYSNTVIFSPILMDHLLRPNEEKSSEEAKWRKVMPIGKRSNRVGGRSQGRSLGRGELEGENHQVSTCPLPDGSIKGEENIGVG